MKWIKTEKILLLSGLVLTLLFSTLYIYRPHLLELMDNKVYDSIVATLPEVQHSGKPIIVEIDEKSLARYGQWPWPRYRVAMLINKLKELGASTVGLDMFFPEKDRTSLSVLREEMYRDLNIDLDIGGISHKYKDNDALLADVLSKGPFVLGYQFLFEKGVSESVKCNMHNLNTIVMDSEGVTGVPNSITKAWNVLCNLNELSESVGSKGFVNSIMDADGVVRRVPLLISYKERLYPNLSLAVFLKSIGENQVVVNSSRGRLESMVIKGRSIPLDEDGTLLVRYHKGYDYFRRVSAADVLAGNISKKALKNKIVFTGATAAGLKDLRTTPLHSFIPGVVIHATVTDNLLKGDYLFRPYWTKGIELLVVLLCGLLYTAVLPRIKALWSLAMALGSTSVLWLASLFLISEGIYFSPFFPTIVIILIFVFLTALKHRRDERRLFLKTQEVSRTQEVAIDIMSSAIETRDHMTGGHIQRTKEYIKTLAEYLRNNKKFRHILDEEYIQLLYRCAPLHDIGKIGVPDSILLKPDRLDNEEFAVMKLHPEYGREIVEKAIEKLGDVTFLQISRDLIYTHQEKWDGSGYPKGLKGEEIPLCGRLMALADVYDALISRRKYKPGFPHEKAVAIIMEGRGTHFDPDLADTFYELEEEFRQIALRFVDSEEEREMLKPMKKKISKANLMQQD